MTVQEIEQLLESIADRLKAVSTELASIESDVKELGEKVDKIGHAIDAHVEIEEAMPEDRLTLMQATAVRHYLTRGSQSRAWCLIDDEGNQCHVFEHAQPERNTYPLFKQAGYCEDFEAMAPGALHVWATHPIEALVYEHEGWLRVAHVMYKPPGARSDDSALEALSDKGETLWQDASEGDQPGDIPF